MALSIKSPPVFDPQEDDDYVSWKNDVGIWRLYTDTKEEKIGAAVYLALKGKAREVVRQLKPEDIGKKEGYDLVMRTLDAVYLKDESTRAFCAFKDFYEYKRSSGEKYSDFIVEHERKYNKLKQFRMELPEGVRAFFLLKAANLTDDSEKLARATAKLEYIDMKEKVMKIFGDPAIQGESGSAPAVKEEVFYSQKKTGDDDQEEVYYGHGYRGHSRGGRGTYRGRVYRGGRGAGKGASGRNLRCHVCDSTRHFVKDCPHKDEQEVNFNVHITLLSSKPDSSQKSLLLESFGKGVLDSGCSKTVAGSTWVDEFTKTLSADKLQKVKEYPSSSVFRFGDGVEAVSTKKVTLPIDVGMYQMDLDVEVVKSEIPLLISKGAMKQMGVTLDFAKDTVRFDNGKEIKLICTSTGHYCLPLTKKLLDVNEVNVILHLQSLETLSKDEKKKKAIKLHKQFSHATKERLLRLIKSSGNHDVEFRKCVEAVCDECEICRKYKKVPLRPVASLPIATEFNQLVAMDLKEFQHNRIWILHLIDAATRYSAATLIHSKKKELVVERIFRIWISYFGSPGKFFFDNGGEFANEVMQDLNEKLGVEMITTAAESPFSNGICERHNAILFETMSKTLEDAKCDPDLALAWAVSAKNALQNRSGYSPNQLVFGYNVNLPTVLTDLPPALEPTTSSNIIRRNLNAMHAARVNYMKAESSEKIRRALRAKTRTFADTRFQIGEKVFYKRQNVKGWRGPGVVTGTDDKIILVRHGSAYYRCHPSHLMKVIKTDEAGSKICKEFSAHKDKIDLRRNSEVYEDDEEGDDSEDAGHDFDHDEDANHEGERTNVSCQDDRTDHFSDVDDQTQSSLSKVRLTTISQSANDLGMSNVSKQEKRPAANMNVTYQLKDGTQYSARVLSKQPKRSGKNGNWINVQVDGNEKPSSVNWDEVSSWETTEDKEKVVLLAAEEEMAQEVVDAKERELRNLIENDVFETVEYKNQPLISCKWVITEKFTDGKKVTKARLVARGFEETILNARTDSPTCSRQALRIVFATAATMNWTLQSLDIRAAFLQGNGIERTVYLKPPREYLEEGLVWKLKRCIYGLKDAPRAWYDRVESELSTLRAKKSIFDDALFMWYDEFGKLEGILVVHVDDFVYTATDEWLQTVMGALLKKFKISRHAEGSFKYIGLNIVQSNFMVQVDQEKYVGALEEVILSTQRSRQKDDLLTCEETTLLRSISGQLLWASSQTRPDVSFDACVVSNYGKEPTVRNLLMANKAIRKLKGNTSKLVYTDLGEPERMRILVYTDATHASLPSGSSQGGLIVFLAGNGRVSPIMWQSKKLTRVTKSPLASETLELAEGADAGFLIAAMIKEVFNLTKLPEIICSTDSKSLTEFLKTSHVIQDTRLRVDVARIREMLKLKEICVKWVPNEIQLADPLTKAGASSAKLLEVLRTAQL